MNHVESSKTLKVFYVFILAGSNKFVTLEEAKKGKIPIANHVLIASIDIDRKGFGENKKFVFNKIADSQMESFLSLRDYERFEGNNGYNGYKLLEGQTIKFAKITAKVLRVSTPNNRSNQISSHNLYNDNEIDTMNFTEFTSENEQNNSQYSYYDPFNKIKGNCRICLGDDKDMDNMGDNCQDFLIQPCDCKGSCSTVHYGCLKRWISKKIGFNRGGKVSIIDFKNFKCEICKANLPKIIIETSENSNCPPKHHYLFNIRLPSSAYVILQPLHKNIWYVLTLNENEKCQIGKSMYSDLIMNQNWISNSHAEISLKNGQFYLKDLGSGAGTFVRLENDLEIKGTMGIQVLGGIYQFRVEKGKK